MGYVGTIGVFDGVHRGHGFLLGALRRAGAEAGLQSAVCVLDMGRGDQLTTMDERVRLLEASGVDAVHVFRFADVQPMTAESFMALLRKDYGIEMLLMGYDHRFGSDRLTDWSAYEACAARVGMRLVRVAAAPGEAVSSSLIREALTAGDMVRANELLGYAYSLTGKVVRGNRIGHTIGFPTANIEPEACKLVPKIGVYAGTISVERLALSEERCVVNIGTNPTVGNEHVTIEAYMPDYKGGELYGEKLTLRLEKRIRDERKFSSLDELRFQIEKDLDSIHN